MELNLDVEQIAKAMWAKDPLASSYCWFKYKDTHYMPMARNVVENIKQQLAKVDNLRELVEILPDGAEPQENDIGISERGYVGQYEAYWQSEEEPHIFCEAGFKTDEGLDLGNCKIIYRCGKPVIYESQLKEKGE